MRGNLVAVFEAIDQRLAFDMFPDQVAKAARFFFLDLQPELRALDRGLDLGAAADDAVIFQQAVDIARAITGDFFRREIVKGFAEVFRREKRYFKSRVCPPSPVLPKSST